MNPIAADRDEIQERRHVIWGVLKALGPQPFNREHGLRELQPVSERGVGGDAGHDQCVQARALAALVVCSCCFELVSAGLAAFAWCLYGLSWSQLVSLRLLSFPAVFSLPQLVSLQGRAQCRDMRAFEHVAVRRPTYMRWGNAQDTAEATVLEAIQPSAFLTAQPRRVQAVEQTGLYNCPVNPYLLDSRKPGVVPQTVELPDIGASCSNSNATTPT